MKRDGISRLEDLVYITVLPTLGIVLFSREISTTYVRHDDEDQAARDMHLGIGGSVDVL